MVLGGTAEVVWTTSDGRIRAGGVVLLDRTDNNDQSSASPIAHPGARRARTGPTFASVGELRYSTLMAVVKARLWPTGAACGHGRTVAAAAAAAARANGLCQTKTISFAFFLDLTKTVSSHSP